MALIKGPWNWNRSSMGIANPNHLGSTFKCRTAFARQPDVMPLTQLRFTT